MYKSLISPNKSKAFSASSNVMSNSGAELVDNIPIVTSVVLLGGKWY